METINLGWLEVILLSSVRIVAFLIVAPPFSYSAIPLQVKAMLSVGLALVMVPRLSATAIPSDGGAFLVALVQEVIVGLALGFLVMLVFSAVQSAGTLVELFGGFQLAQAFDPQSLVNGAQFTRLFNLTALALLFATEGYQLVLGGLTRSFTALPIGSGIDWSVHSGAIITGVSQMFLAAVQIAGPLLVILILADVGLGLLTRVSPALNAFALSFPLKILITLSFVGMIFLALPRIVSSLTGDAVDLLVGTR